MDVQIGILVIALRKGKYDLCIHLKAIAATKTEDVAKCFLLEMKNNPCLYLVYPICISNQI